MITMVITTADVVYPEVKGFSLRTLRHMTQAFVRSSKHDYSFHMVPSKGIIYLESFDELDRRYRLDFRVSVPDTSPEAWADIVTEIMEELV